MKNIIMSIIFLGLLGYIFYDRNQKNKLREGVVNNAKGEIITLYSLASGIGPNLVAIRDLFE